MLRLLHTADVHLGARHADLGEAATDQRERQFAAFKVAVDLAIAEKVDAFLVAGDLFDSNAQPRRSVERVAAELARLANTRIRTVVIPGTHDCYDRSSIYRAYDLKALAGSSPHDDLVTVMTPDTPALHLPTLDARRPRGRLSRRSAPRTARSATSASTQQPSPTPRGTSAWSTARSPSPTGRIATRS